MENEKKTHYRKAFNSPYLSSADITEPTNLTIKHVKLEPDKSKRTKDVFNTVYFVEKNIRDGEPLKPMILNAHNSKIMKLIGNSAFIDDWNDLAITVYVDSNVRFGRDTVEGLRISPTQPKTRQELKQGTIQWDNAIVAYKRDGNLEAVRQRVNVSTESEELIKAAANVA
ncbi:MAG: hypothetical protein ACUZ8H_03855 [Candidatus Anammoxibacter sp.]